MTLAQFLQALSFATTELEEFDSHTPGDPIRLYNKDNVFCPITAVCYVNTGKKYRMSHYIDAALSIGLKIGLATKIAYAADSGRTTSSKRLRGQLLDAIGLDNDLTA